MTFVIAEPCIGEKSAECVDACPVSCIHPAPHEPEFDEVSQLYIDPRECIDCSACVAACPVDACFSDDDLPEEWRFYETENAEYFRRQRRARKQQA